MEVNLESLDFKSLRERALHAARDRNKGGLDFIHTLAIIQIAQELNEIKHTLREQKEPIELSELLAQLIRRQDG